MDKLNVAQIQIIRHALMVYQENIQYNDYMEFEDQRALEKEVDEILNILGV